MKTEAFSCSDPAPTPSPAIKLRMGCLLGIALIPVCALAQTTDFSVLASFSPRVVPHYSFLGYPVGCLLRANDGGFYGLAEESGNNEQGNVFCVTASGDYRIVHTFAGNDPSSQGAYPVGSLIQGSDGALYGIAATSEFASGCWGCWGRSLIFKVNPDGTAFTVLRVLEPSEGSTRFGGGVYYSTRLSAGSGGILYGAMEGGGNHDAGTIFRIAEDGSDFAVLHHFDIAGGSGPSPVIHGSDGALYGTTYGGGNGLKGTVFRLDPADQNSFTLLHEFCGVDGQRPAADLLRGSDGALYGTTTDDEAATDGTVFRINENGSEFAIIHHFNGEDGGRPGLALVEGSDGVLYGTTFDSARIIPHGIIFKVDKDGTGFGLLHQFLLSGSDGGGPYALTRGDNGALYGTTSEGGDQGWGPFFTIQEGGGDYCVIASFTWSQDVFITRPTSGLVQGSDGALYGTATWLHDPPWYDYADFGSIFRVNPDGSDLRVIFHFDGFSGLVGGLTKSVAGTLLGFTTTGGDHGFGTMFRINEDGSGHVVLHSFDPATDGIAPNANLVKGADGALYGVTQGGWTGGGPASEALSYGAVFKVASDGSGFTVVHRFGAADGGFPGSALVEGSNGALYGTTSSSSIPYATIFKVNKDGTGFAELHRFSQTDYPGWWLSWRAGITVPSLIRGSNGALYGSTSGFSDIPASVFRFTEDDGVLGVLQWFAAYDDTIDDGGPGSVQVWLGGPIEGADGRLYGTWSRGGFYLDHQDDGIFVIRQERGGVWPENAGYEILHQFSRPDGYRPIARLLETEPGLFLGTAARGGDSDLGTIFRMTVPVARPVITQLSPDSTSSGSGDLDLTIDGAGFNQETTIYWDRTPLLPYQVSYRTMKVIVPGALVETTHDLLTIPIRAEWTTGERSVPKGFTIVRASSDVAAVEGAIVLAGEPVSVSVAPESNDTSGVSAVMTHDGEEPALVSVAVYNSDPSPGSASFQTAGQFLDINVSGATSSDSMLAYFYYAAGPDSAGLTLKFYNQNANPPAWEDVTPVKTNDLALQRFEVIFDSSSHPSIMDLGGTFFAAALPDRTPPTVQCANVNVPCSVDALVPVSYPEPAVLYDDTDPRSAITVAYSIPSGAGFKAGVTTVACTATDRSGNQGGTTFTVTREALGFGGFLSPLGGADATGGSFASPLRTFKMTSTIPVKFTATCGGSPVLTGAHSLTLVKYSDATTAGTPIDATPQEAATTGNQFRLASGQWQFNLDTKATGMSTGIWLVTVELSDGSQHHAWIQLK